MTDEELRKLATRVRGTVERGSEATGLRLQRVAEALRGHR